MYGVRWDTKGSLPWHNKKIKMAANLTVEHIFAKNCMQIIWTHNAKMKHAKCQLQL